MGEKMRRSSLPGLLVLVAIFVCFLQVNGQTCSVKGRILDVLVNDAVMPGVEVTFRGRKTKKVVSDDDGNYEIILPSGAYSVSIARPIVKPLYERSSIILTCPETISLNLYPLPEKSSDGINFNFTRLSQVQNSSVLSAVVSYLSKKTERNRTTYKFCILTMNKETLFADSITFGGTKILIKGAKWYESAGGRDTFENGTDGSIKLSKSGFSFERR